MPVVESEDSRSASSDNESESGVVSRHSSPVSARGSPVNGPQSPDSHRSRSRSRSQESNASRSRSSTPESRSQSPTNGYQNGSRSSRSPNGSRSSSSEKETFPYEANIQHLPESPKSNVSEHSGSRPTSPNSEKSTASRKDAPKSPPSSRDSSPELNKSEEVNDVVPTQKQESDSEEDNHSVKSGSSKSSQKSRSSVESKKSRGSSHTSSRGSRRSRRKSGSSSDSDSSVSSVDSSSRKNKDIRAADTQPEDVSDGDMESDNEGTPTKTKITPPKSDLNISHEDLSDVSDLEDSIGANSDEEDGQISRKNEDKVLQNGDGDERDNFEKQVIEKSQSNSRPEDGEEQLDFEAEDGECGELESKEDDKVKEEKEEGEEDGKDESESAPKEEKELEEGEVTDEDDARPEETESRPVCRFFSRGACTWGASCRFLHPGVTDKGNYTMFDMVRPMLPGEFGMGRMMDDRMYGKSEQPLTESAWERGLRTAKEMLKKSMRRKEQDIDFEEKKMNLSIAQEEFDKENGYYGRIPSPEPRYVRHLPEYPASRPPVEEYYGRRQVVYEPEYAALQRREHVRAPYREMVPHRGVPPEYFKYDEETSSRAHERMEGRERERDRERRKPKREVIVQRGSEENRQTRADEWQDPWMRSKSPGRRKDRKRSYSSGSSTYSSSSTRSTSPSSKSSYRSRSRSTYRRGRSRSRKGSRHVSPSIIVSERKAANERAALMNPPAPKRRVPSPGMMRVSSAANPPAPSREDHLGRARSKLAVAAALARVKSRSKRMSKSSSGSSSGSSSDSDSSESSSSSSRSNSPSMRDARKTTDIVKAMDALKGGALEKNKIKLNLKNPPMFRKPDVPEARKIDAVVAKKRPATSPPPNDPKAKKATSRREELLKQLKAVEDAIAKKRSKV